MINKWDERFINLAAHVADWSKDPSTKVGAVITKDKKVVSLGFNGFPAGVDDCPKRLEEKLVKYSMIVHAEANAILTAGHGLQGCTIYSTLSTCNECAKLIIQSGIKKVVCRKSKKEKWNYAFMIAKKMYEEAGVEVVEYE
jgi:dCMP deaminase